MKGIKKIITGLLAVACLTSAFAFTGCGDDNYTASPLAGYEETKNAPVESNGGFAVKKGNWIYFINGTQYYTASNEYGDAVRGSLMRISQANFDAGKFTQAEIVVPQLFVAQDYDAGLFIYGDYVYYATPTTDKDIETGEVQRTAIDFKRAKLDGSETMKGHYFRLENNTSNYRYVADEKGVVYCLYEEDTTLKSYNTVTGENTTLVKGASSSFYYDTDVTDPKVYYTMSVSKGLDTDNPTTMEYNELYCVSAFATATVDPEKASYTTSSGKTYDFDETWMKRQNDKVEEESEEKDPTLPYDFEDYSTYPYVNLGDVVLNGIGNMDGESASSSVGGYTYTITTYQNDGVYFTRQDLPKTDSPQEGGVVYYLLDTAKDAENFNPITANQSVKEIARNSQYASSSAIYTKEGDNFVYYYNNAGSIYKQIVDGELIMLTNAEKSLQSSTLWKVEGEYLYFYQENNNGNSLGRIKATGSQTNYQEAMLGESEEYAKPDEYRAQILTYVDYGASWYKPEIFGDTLLYANVQSFGSKTYNYIYATKLDSVQAVKERIAEYNKVYEEINKAKGSELQNAMTYYFRTGQTDAYEAVKEEVYTTAQQEAFEEFKAKFQGDEAEFKLESAYYTLMGRWSDEDAEAIKQSWVDLLTPETEETEEEGGLPWWAIVLICVGSALVVGVTAFIVIRKIKAKRRAKREAEATVNAYKRKRIDTTDDKSIDVYADDEETVEETPVSSDEEN